MKFKSLFIAALAILAFSACDSKTSSDDIQPQPEGSTFASVQIVTKDATRALDDTQTNHKGTEKENTLTELKMISSLTPLAIWTAATTPATDAVGTFWKVANGYQTASVNASPGLQKLALIFNPDTLNIGVATQTNNHLYAGALAGLIKDNAFVMTSSGFEKTIVDNINEATNKTGTGDAQNVFKNIEVERVVAKGIVRESSNFTNKVVRGTTEIATVKNLKFAAVNGATKTFLYRDNAGSRTMNDADPNEYAKFKSAIHNIGPAETAEKAANLGLVRLGNSLADVHTPKNVNKKGTEVDKAQAFYFMENSGLLTATNHKSEGFYRYAYAKVYVTYIPTEVLALEGEKLVSKPGVAEKTFYRGKTDNLLYDTKDAAKKSAMAPNQEVYTYTNGKCGYRALWNKQTGDTSDRKVIVNADTRRNNVYMLDIKDFAGIGFPWDSSDPNDPNLPKPGDDPEDKPDDPNIEPTETFMRVEAVILPWNLVVRDNITLK